MPNNTQVTRTSFSQICLSIGTNAFITSLFRSSSTDRLLGSFALILVRVIVHLVTNILLLVYLLFFILGESKRAGDGSNQSRAS